MDPAILATFRTRIELEIAAIRGRLQQHTQNAVGTDLNEMADTIDRASVEESRYMELNRIEHEKNKLRLLVAALARIERGDFGYCESCGIDIGISRLEIKPESAYCIECQNIDEIRAHQYKK